MKAPVATNKWNLAFAIKNTSSGPSSVASLNSGCGWVLSIFSLYLFGHDLIRKPVPTFRDHALFNSCNRLREIARGERREIVDAFADADEVHRQFEFLRQGHQDAAARGAVELGHDEPRDPSGTMKRLDLRQRILSYRGIQHQQHGMRRRRIDLLDDANDFFKLVHQFGLVLQAARGVDQEHVELSFPRRSQCVEGKARGIRALRAGDDRRFGALAPDL